MAALEELLSERVRYQQALDRIGQQLQHLSADPPLHIHLKPPDGYQSWSENGSSRSPPEAMTAEQGIVSTGPLRSLDLRTFSTSPSTQASRSAVSLRSRAGRSSGSPPGYIISAHQGHRNRGGW